MNEDAVRQYLAKSGFPVPDDVWRRLKDMGLVTPALQDGPEGEAARAALLKSAYRELADWHHVHTGRRSDAHLNEVDPEFESDDLERAGALNQWFVKHAAASPEVCSFRQQVLGGSRMDYCELEEDFEERTSGMTEAERSEALARFQSDYPKPKDVTLTNDKAYALVASPAAKCLCDGQFKAWGIPVVGHKAMLSVLPVNYPPSAVRKHDGPSVTLTFLPSGDRYQVRASSSVIAIDGYKLVPGKKAPLFPAEPWGAKTHAEARHAVAIRTPGLLEYWGPYDATKTADIERIKRHIEEDAAVLPSQRQCGRPFEETLEYPGKRGGGVWTVGVWPGSVLDELRLLSESLAETYHWRKSDAAWFVLTGTKPPIRPFWPSTTTRRGDPFSDALTTFEVLPWVSWVTICKVYRQIQCGLHVGATRKLPSARALEVFRFVTRVSSKPVVAPDEWDSLSRKWLEEHPEEKILRYPSQLKRYYDRAHKVLLQHDFEAARRERNS